MLFRGNFNDNSSVALREKKDILLIMSTLKDFCHNFFETIFLPDDEKHIAS